MKAIKKLEINKWGYIKLKNLCQRNNQQSKETTNILEEKTSKHAINKELICKNIRHLNNH
jgi:hypothetical protein